MEVPVKLLRLSELLLLLLTVLHVLLEGFTLMNGLPGIRVILWCYIASVVFSPHGPSKLSSCVPVRLVLEDSGGKSCSRGHSEGGSRGNEGGKKDKLLHFIFDLKN